ncbi:MAG: imelysin family protein [Bacteroidota bacterium]
MIKRHSLLSYIFLLLLAVSFTACSNDSGEDEPTETDFTNLLTNQVNQVIVPTMEAYQSSMEGLVDAVNGFASTSDANNLSALRAAFQDAYLAYQAAAVHNYFATANQALVTTSNLFPVDVTLLEELIENETYNFSTTAQEKANGFPAIDYLLYGPADVLTFFDEDDKRLAFLQALVNSMKAKADVLVDQWTGNLRTAFIGNGGTEIGSSVSTQLNEATVYYELRIREDKVGIPIGRLGPNDSPIAADPTKIEAYYQSLFADDESFTLSLVRAAIEELEDLYLGSTATDVNDQGYDDLLLARDQASVDTDIKAQFEAIYNEIASRSSISGDEDLYNAVQGMVTLFKSDLFTVLNVQDADGMVDGD